MQPACNCICVADAALSWELSFRHIACNASDCNQWQAAVNHIHCQHGVNINDAKYNLMQYNKKAGCPEMLWKVACQTSKQHDRQAFSRPGV